MTDEGLRGESYTQLRRGNSSGYTIYLFAPHAPLQSVTDEPELLGFVLSGHAAQYQPSTTM